MKAKFAIAASLVLILTPVLLMPTAYAHSCKKMGGHHLGIEDKLSWKAHFILKNQEELGLSDKQVQEIKDLKLKAQKEQIRQEAEIEIIALDIKAKMYKETIDIKAINKLIDEKYELKKAKAKSSVEDYAKLKDVLTGEQKEKLKGLWKKCKTEKEKS